MEGFELHLLKRKGSVARRDYGKDEVIQKNSDE